MANFLTGENRISRFHDEKGNFVDLPGLLNAVPAFTSAAAKRLFGYRPRVPVISYRARRLIANLLTPESRMVEFGSGNSTPWFAARSGRVLSIEDLPIGTIMCNGFSMSLQSIMSATSYGQRRTMPTCRTSGMERWTLPWLMAPTGRAPFSPWYQS